jgi:hypothetical protein
MKSKFDLVVEYLKNPAKTIKTQEQNIKLVNKILKPESVKIVRFK